MDRVKIFVAVAALTTVLTIPPAQAGNVSVRLKVASGTYLNTVASCSVSVPQGADGIAVLDAAKASGCITSYKLITYTFGSFVDCIGQVCTGTKPPYYFWAMRENSYVGSTRLPVCTSTDYGVSDFDAQQGEELSFTYETLATGLAPGVCPA